MRSFAIDDAFRKAVSALRGVNQRLREDEIEFYIRLTDPSNLCGNVNLMDEQMTMFIEGLNPIHRTIVSQYRSDNPKVPFLRLINYVMAKGAAIRA